MLPARQRFHADNPSARNLDLGLETDRNFTGVHRRAQIDRQLIERLVGDIGGMRGPPRCPTRRRIGQSRSAAPHQCGGILARAAPRNGERRTNRHDPPFDCERPRHCFAQGRSREFDARRVAVPTNEELRTAQSCDHRAAPESTARNLLDPAADRTQQCIACAAAISGVDHLEPAYPDQDHPDRRILAYDAVFDPASRRRRIARTGQRIAHRHACIGHIPQWFDQCVQPATVRVALDMLDDPTQPRNIVGERSRWRALGQACQRPPGLDTVPATQRPQRTGRMRRFVQPKCIRQSGRELQRACSVVVSPAQRLDRLPPRGCAIFVPIGLSLGVAQPHRQFGFADRADHEVRRARVEERAQPGHIAARHQHHQRHAVRCRRTTQRCDRREAFLDRAACIDDAYRRAACQHPPFRALCPTRRHDPPSRRRRCARQFVPLSKRQDEQHGIARCRCLCRHHLEANPPRSH